MLILMRLKKELNASLCSLESIILSTCKLLTESLIYICAMAISSLIRLHEHYPSSVCITSY